MWTQYSQEGMRGLYNRHCARNTSNCGILLLHLPSKWFLNDFDELICLLGSHTPCGALVCYCYFDGEQQESTDAASTRPDINKQARITSSSTQPRVKHFVFPSFSSWLRHLNTIHWMTGFKTLIAHYVTAMQIPAFCPHVQECNKDMSLKAFICTTKHP